MIGVGPKNSCHPLPREIAALTGLGDTDLTGQEIDRERLTRFIDHCDGVIAFNAGFDRPHVEKLLPALRALPWNCALKDVPWRQLGFEPGPQNYLLMQTGRYNRPAHRAHDVVLSLIEVLAHACAAGESVMGKVRSASISLTKHGLSSAGRTHRPRSGGNNGPISSHSASDKSPRPMTAPLKAVLEAKLCTAQSEHEPLEFFCDYVLACLASRRSRSTSICCRSISALLSF